MIQLTLEEMIQAVNPINQDQLTTMRLKSGLVTNISFDSRLIEADGLFVPLAGQRDGHEFIDQAVANGAVASLWSKPLDEAPDQLAIIQVEDVLEAFQDLARYYRQKVNPYVVAITGSNGKTTTKDLLKGVLARSYQVAATKGNYNNHIGLPQTILTMPTSTEVLILEMGMSDFHEIERLSQIAQPDLAIITMIGEAHIEQLGSRRGIARAKLEVLAGLKEEGYLIYPAEEPLLAAELAENPRQVNRLTFGQSPKSNYQVLGIKEASHQTRFSLHYPQGRVVDYTLPIMGAYNAVNAASVVAVADRLEILPEQIQLGFSKLELTPNRMEWVDGQKGQRLLNDAYNASPTSMKKAIQSFQAIPLAQGSKWLVLGDMRELGVDSPAYHASLADVIQLEDLAGVFLYGREMQALYQRILSEAVARPSVFQLYYEADDLGRLINLVDQQTQQGDYLLVKSSNGTNLLALVKALKKEGQA